MASNYIFYRVEDDDSQARTVRGKGVLARDKRTSIDFNARRPQECWELRRYIMNHLDWAHRQHLPFISVYDDENTAVREAERRVEQRKRNVTITVIDVKKAWRKVEYRSVRKLACWLEFWIPKQAWHNSKHEYLFFCHIPARAVVFHDGYEKFKRGLLISRG
ncbi:hypothetical protein BKA67DRAFT_584593 [Truncatella angustata]|uniref:DUF7587 domain-containing protein n=1 Tax=Truncatella angustata TaxID=152316 RepID=A0A9P8RI80_9PEZI|nr:uncharacterized protein BKA67DRAFT_584593 [Truncatella angustata]KAH6646509.1 hypothetical protein BKA67DRAFT_584593 [Truncatella angustata]